jgi:tight adherence protein C
MAEVYRVLGKSKPEDTPLADPGDYVFGPVTPVLAALLPESESRRSEVKLELSRAGYYQPHALQNLAAIRYVCIIAPLVVLGVMLLFAPPVLERFLLGAMLILPAFGWALPRLYLKSRASERAAQIESGLPDMLDMLNMCVSQGMTVSAAFKRISRELATAHPALHKELQIVIEQAEIGSMQHALENFSRRIDVPEVHSFVSLLTQTERMGTGVSVALAEYSDNIREGLKQRADEKGNRAAFKLLFPTVMCLMPAVYMFLLGPSVVEFTNFVNRDDQTIQNASQVIQRTGQSGRAQTQ